MEAERAARLRSRACDDETSPAPRLPSAAVPPPDGARALPPFPDPENVSPDAPDARQDAPPDARPDAPHAPHAPQPPASLVAPAPLAPAATAPAPIAPEFRGRRLRVGLLVDSLVQPAWAAEIIRELAASEFAELALVIHNVGDPTAPPKPVRRSLGARARVWYRNRHALPFTAYVRLDARRYAPRRHPEAPVDLAALLGDLPRVDVAPRMTKFCDYFPDPAADAIAEHRLDVALRFGFRILKGRALRVARYGVWSYHHGDNLVNRGGPAGFWEVWAGETVTGAVLQQLTEDLDGGCVISRMYARTETKSFARNRENFYWLARHLMPQALRTLHEQGPAAVGVSALVAAPDAATSDVPTPDAGPAARPAPAADFHAYSQRLFIAPRPGEVARLGARIATRIVRDKVRSMVHREQWFLAYRLAPADPARDGVPDASPYRFRELLPPSDRYWADPFPVIADDRRWIFFEEHPFASRNAHIAVVEIDAKGGAGTPRVVLKRDHHLSYPNVFRWRGEWYMMPETAQRGVVEVYRAVRFPDEWELVAEMLPGAPVVDPTIAEIGDRWWMFCAALTPGTTEESVLNIHHGPSPLGPWTPHRRNPVRVDVRGARPAGRLFRYNGRWYRPGQFGAPTYGSALAIHRIDELTPTRFTETEVTRLTPTWRPGLTGTHTINAAGPLTVIDARHRIRP